MCVCLLSQQIRNCRSGSGIAFTNSLIPSQADMAGHSRTPLSPSPQGRLKINKKWKTKEEDKRKLQSKVEPVRPPLSRYPPLLLRGSHHYHPSQPRIAREVEYCLSHALIPQQPD